MHSILGLLLVSVVTVWQPPSVWAQEVILNQGHNVTSLEGTWSSGSGAVRTGVGFANPINFTFSYPATAGISYSFTTDVLSDGSAGYFEEAQYRFTSNGTQPTCIVGVVQWQHGTYALLPNGSMVLNPFASDGRQQVQDMCAAKSNIIQQFNQTTLFQSWAIYQDAQKGPKLQIFQFNGAPLPPMFLLSPTPNMLPTTTLTANVTQGQTTLNAGLKRATVELMTMLGAAVLAALAGMLTLV